MSWTTRRRGRGLKSTLRYICRVAILQEASYRSEPKCMADLDDGFAVVAAYVPVFGQDILINDQEELTARRDDPAQATVYADIIADIVVLDEIGPLDIW